MHQVGVSFDCFITLSITIIKRVADRGSPCVTPETILNSFVNSLPIFYFEIESLWVSPIGFINFFGTSLGFSFTKDNFEPPANEG